MYSRRYVFVLEQKLGHISHGLNICRIIRDEAGVDPTVIKIPPGPDESRLRLPSLPNWSVEASLTTRLQLERRLRARPVDAIFVHTQVSALLIGRIMRRVPTVVSLDATPINIDSMAAAYNHPLQPYAVEAVKRRITARALANAAAVVTWSDWAARSVVADYGVAPGKVTSVYPGVDLERFRPRAGARPEGPMRVLFVGGDFQRKGGEDLIEAVRRMEQPVELDVVTRDDSFTVPPGLEVRVHTDVEPNSIRMLELYSRADAFALPTKGDAVPMVIAEAMASGLPVVATTVGSIPDMVTSGGNGLLVEPGDVDGLRGALSSLASCEDLRRHMGEQGRKTAEAEHDVVANVHRILALLDEVSRRST